MSAYLTKLQKELLEVLKPYTGGQNRLYHYTDLADKVITKTDTNEIAEALGELKDRGLVRFEPLQNGPCFIYLSHQGIRFKEIRFANTRKAWADRLIGFITGALTTVLAWWLSTIK